MLTKIKVVSAYVPLDVRHLTREQYLNYGSMLADAVGRENMRIYNTPLEQCWLYKLMDKEGKLDLLPATQVPSDRYASPLHMVKSNIVQHQRTTWLKQAADEFPEVDTLIWLDLAIMKQGGFTGKPVTADVLRQFVERVNEASPLDHIPFPGIWDKGPINPSGDNWRFCGSTHIIPRQFLAAVHDKYVFNCRAFIDDNHTVPLDLPIWAKTEQSAELPFRWYPANHDATQLSNFPL